MMKRLLLRWAAIFIGVLCLTLVGEAQVQTFFRAELSGGNEVPKVTSNAVGIGIFLLNPAGTELTYQITVDGLSGPITAAHFHNAATGTNGSIVKAITFSGGTASGTWTGLTQNQVTELFAGKIYVNVHTAANPGGEIRGQVETTPDFLIELTGDQENPPVTTSANGFGVMFIDRINKFLEYIIDVDLLSGPITLSHIHKAQRGSNGPVVFDLTSSFMETTAFGRIENLTADQLNDLDNGNYYVNVHTDAQPAGEVRGQIDPWVNMVAQIDGKQENPSVTTNAKGTGLFIFDPGAAILSYDIIVSGLSGAITDAHFHNAPAGQNGSVVFNIILPMIGNHARGAWTNISSTMMAALLAGKMYVNFHTVVNPAGEIRGQILSIFQTSTAVKDSKIQPDGITLSQNYPNPFGIFTIAGGTTTQIDFSVSNNTNVTLAVFNLLSQRVATVIDQQEYAEGIHTITFDAKSLESGVYVYRLTADGKQLIRKMTVMK